MSSVGKEESIALKPMWIILYLEGGAAVNYPSPIIATTTATTVSFFPSYLLILTF